MRAAVHDCVPESVRIALLAWLPDSEFAVSLLDHAVASTEVIDAAGPVGVSIVVEGRRSLSGAPVVVACAGTSAALGGGSPTEAVADKLARTVVPRAQATGAVEVVGPGALGRRVAEAVAACAGGQAETVMNERLMVATDVQAPPGVPGTCRASTSADHRLIGTWLEEFAVEALDVEPVSVEQWVERLGEAAWEQWLWEVDGEVVSLVNARATTPVSSRLGPVYTPPSMRGQGYAAALTAHAAQVLLDRGDDRVTLFTDEANPTSNALYARVGFADIGAHGSWLVSVEHEAG